MNWLYVRLILYPLVAANYWMRRRKWLADRWFWADGAMLSRFYWVDPHYKLRRWGEK